MLVGTMLVFARVDFFIIQCAPQLLHGHIFSCELDSARLASLQPTFFPLFARHSQRLHFCALCPQHILACTRQRQRQCRNGSSERFNWHQPHMIGNYAKTLSIHSIRFDCVLRHFKWKCSERISANGLCNVQAAVSFRWEMKWTRDRRGARRQNQSSNLDTPEDNKNQRAQSWAASTITSGSNVAVRQRWPAKPGNNWGSRLFLLTAIVCGPFYRSRSHQLRQTNKMYRLAVRCAGVKCQSNFDSNSVDKILFQGHDSNEIKRDAALWK